MTSLEVSFRLILSAGHSPGELVDYVERAAISCYCRPSFDKIVGAYMVGTFRRKTDGRSIMQPEPALPQLLWETFRPTRR